jgi:hypothetical protein
MEIALEDADVVQEEAGGAVLLAEVVVPAAGARVPALDRRAADLDGGRVAGGRIGEADRGDRVEARGAAGGVETVRADRAAAGDPGDAVVGGAGDGRAELDRAARVREAEAGGDGDHDGLARRDDDGVAAREGAFREGGVDELDLG